MHGSGSCGKGQVLEIQSEGMPLNLRFPNSNTLNISASLPYVLSSNQTIISEPLANRWTREFTIPTNVRPTERRTRDITSLMLLGRGGDNKCAEGSWNGFEYAAYERLTDIRFARWMSSFHTYLLIFIRIRFKFYRFLFSHLWLLGLCI